MFITGAFLLSKYYLVYSIIFSKNHEFHATTIRRLV